MAESRNTIAVIPQDITNPVELRRFLELLIERLDVAIGVRNVTGTVELNLVDLEARVTKLENP